MKPTSSHSARPQRREPQKRREPLARRRGQALLLAVLLMVFAALLAATMITLVSSNLSQTTRQGGLSSARASSGGALAFINDRLTNSTEGEMWRPWMINKPPKPGDSDFNSYYSEFERAQGWTNEVDFSDPAANANRNGNDIDFQTAVSNNNQQEIDEERFLYYDEQATGLKADGTPILKADGTPTGPKRCYVKFPDPRGPATNASGPQYLVQVAPDVNSAGVPTRLLKVVVIGLSEDEAGAFDLRTAYKPTAASKGPFSYARFDSNYNYKGKGLARTKLRQAAAGAAAPTILHVGSTVGLEAGRTVVIGDDPTAAQPAVVTAVDNTNPADPTVTVNAAVTAAPNVPVTAASPLMDGILDADFNADGDTASTTGATNAWERMVEPVRYTDPTTRPEARNLFFNGGLVLQSKVSVALGATDTLSVAGIIPPNPTPVPGATPSVQAFLRDAAMPAGIPASTPLPTSDQQQAPGLQSQVRDNRGPESSYVQPLTPPSIDGDNSRYRQMTQYENVLGGSLLGYDQGVYIDNFSDVEKKTVAGQAVPLTVAESQRLFENKDTVPASTTPLPFPTPSLTPTPAPAPAYNPVPDYVAPAVGTLEERHMRGWVSPWEFRARGISIELKGNLIIFTRDDRSDDVAGGALANRPDPGKAWKQPDGSAMSMGAATYRMILDVTTGQRMFGAPGAEVAVGPAIPFNGLIFTEGNARVRGYLDSKDITIVSMNNIFIEGSLVRDLANPSQISRADPTFPMGAKVNPPRIALMAKRNVVLNPTQLVSRVDGTQDRDVAPVVLAKDADAGASSIQVKTPEAMRVGDIVRVGNDRLWHQVKSINLAASTLALSTPLGPTPTGAGPVGIIDDPVRRLSDPILKSEAAPLSETFYAPSPYIRPIPPGTPINSEVLARDVKLDGVTTAVPSFLSWLHAGQSTPGISFERPTTATTPGTFHTREKRPTNPPTTTISGSMTQTNNEKWFFGSGDPLVTPLPQDDLRVDLLDVNNNGMRDGDAVENLTVLKVRFAATTPPGLGPTWNVTFPIGVATVAARRLAAIGLSVGDADPSVPVGQKYAIPLAISGGWYFQPQWNPAASSLLPPPAGSAPKPVPWQTIGVSNTPEGDDDLETTREGFYQTGGGPSPSPAPVQAPLRWLSAPLLASAVSAIDPKQSNITTFSHDADEIAGVPAGALPEYRVGALKIERDDFAPGAAIRAFNPVPVYVQATIFAQEGSWFVITPTLNSAASTTPTRYRRPNYRAIIKGTIVQNFAPTARTDENGQGGALQGWINALSFPTNIESDIANPANGRGRDWQGIEYEPDPVPFYNSLYLPPTPDLLYTS